LEVEDWTSLGDEHEPNEFPTTDDDDSGDGMPRLLTRNGWDYDSDDESDDERLPHLIPKKQTESDDESDDELDDESDKPFFDEGTLNLLEDTPNSKLAAACALLGIQFDIGESAFMASSASETNKKYDDLRGLESRTTNHVSNRDDSKTDRVASNKQVVVSNSAVVMPTFEGTVNLRDKDDNKVTFAETLCIPGFARNLVSL
jgi:hypothetical protein